MNNYNTLLLAIDLSEETTQLVDKAKNLATANNASLHVLHVIEPLSFAYGGDVPMDFSSIQDEIQKQAQTQLADFSNSHGIAAEKQHITIGRPENEIHEVADKIAADLIIVGSHGRHGLALLLGSTANGVLQGATCDVLAIRVADT